MEFLGQMPTPPPVSPDQWISTFVEKCKHDDMISDTEIAENMGITVNSVLNIIHRAKYKFSRYMFIMHYMDKMPERKIINALNSGEYNKINYNDFF
jgi:predicted DNA-binding protein YlxM (UPF0122 family)